jgi:thiol-disulfide isomerase/thioredoxin
VSVVVCGTTLLAALVFAAPAQAVSVGEPAPTFNAKELDGSGMLSLTKFRGKVVYVDFWASWCAPCATALPALEALRKEFPAGDFQILAINVDKDPQKARRFLERTPVGYPSASDPDGHLPATFGLETMPTSYLIDRRGIVRHVHEGFEKGDVEGLREHIQGLIGAAR